MWVPWGSGLMGERVSLNFFCYVVTVLQKAENHCQYWLSAVTESVTQPGRLRYEHHRPRLRASSSERFAGKNLNNKIHPAVVTKSVTKSVTDNLLRQTESSWVPCADEQKTSSISSSAPLEAPRAPSGANRRTTNKDKQRHDRSGHTEPMQHIERNEPLNAIAGNQGPERLDIGMHDRIQAQM